MVICGSYYILHIWQHYQVLYSTILNCLAFRCLDRNTSLIINKIDWRGGGGGGGEGDGYAM